MALCCFHVCWHTLLSEWAEVCETADSWTSLPSVASSNESSPWSKDDLLFLAVNLKLMLSPVPQTSRDLGKNKYYWISCEAVELTLSSEAFKSLTEKGKMSRVSAGGWLLTNFTPSHLLQTYQSQHICKVTVWRSLKNEREPLILKDPELGLSVDWKQRISCQILHASIPDRLQPPPVPSPEKLHFLLPHPSHHQHLFFCRWFQL